MTPRVHVRHAWLMVKQLPTLYQTGGLHNLYAPIGRWAETQTPSESFRQSYQRLAAEKNLLNLGPQKVLVERLDDLINSLKHVPSPTQRPRNLESPSSGGGSSPLGSPSRGLQVMRSLFDHYQAKRSITDLENSLSCGFRKTPDADSAQPNRTPVHDAFGAKGLYIWGPVGQGKTMILDMFSDYAESVFGSSCVVRCHYSDFMLSVYALLHDGGSPKAGGLTATASLMSFKDFLQDYLKMSVTQNPALGQLNEEGTSPRGRKTLAQAHSASKLEQLASSIISQGVRIILLDELQINHISDALIFKRLAEALIRKGVIFIMTSNCPPEKLYEGGLNRSQFLPFLKTLAVSCPALLIDTAQDLRCWAEDNTVESADEQQKQPSYVAPGRPERLFRKTLLRIETGFKSKVKTDVDVKVLHGRTLPLLLYQEENKIGLASFAQLCEAPRAQSDYIGLSRLVQRKLYLCGVPQLDVRRDADTCRRFLSLVDIITDRDISLHVEAAVPPLKLITGISRIVDNFDALCLVLLKNFKSWEDFRSRYRSSPHRNSLQLSVEDWKEIVMSKFLTEDDTEALWRAMAIKGDGDISSATENPALSDKDLKSAICFHIIYALAYARHYTGNVPSNDNSLASRMLRFMFGDTSPQSFIKAATEAGRENGGYALDKSLISSCMTTEGAFAVPRLISRLCSIARPHH